MRNLFIGLNQEILGFLGNWITVSPADTYEIANKVLPFHFGKHLPAILEQPGQAVFLVGIIFSAGSNVPIRAYQNVAVHGRCGMGCKTAPVIRCRVHRSLQEGPCLFVQHIVFAFVPSLVHEGIAQHLANGHRIGTCAVDDPFGTDYIPVGGNLIHALFGVQGASLQVQPGKPFLVFHRIQMNNAGYLRTQAEFHTVLAGIFGQGDIVLDRIQNPRSRYVHSKVAACIGLNPVHFFLVHHANPLDSVGFPIGLESQDVFPVMLRKTYHQFPRPFERYAQLGCYRIKLLVAFHRTLGPQAAQLIGEACMKHPCIPAGIPSGHVQFFFQHNCVQFIFGQLSCNGAPYYPGANDCYIILLHNDFLLRLL